MFRFIVVGLLSFACVSSCATEDQESTQLAPGECIVLLRIPKGEWSFKAIYDEMPNPFVVTAPTGENFNIALFDAGGTAVIAGSTIPERVRRNGIRELSSWVDQNPQFGIVIDLSPEPKDCPIVAAERARELMGQ